MGQTLSWLANSVLFVLCCYLVADTANEVFAALLTPTAADEVAVPASAPAPRHSWADREAILKRNLFNASLLAPPAPVVAAPPEEDLESTQLPLRLLGTAASTPAELSWAAVEDQSERRTAIVKVNDQIQKATVERIERRRIVLSESGVLRELVLDDENASGIAPKAGGRAGARSARTNRRPRIPGRSARRPGPSTTPTPPPVEEIPETLKKLAEDRFQVDRDEIDDLMRNPANLFSQARILPKYTDGEMVGLQINAIKPGSLFEEIGIQSGDVITNLNGISIENPEESAKILAEFSEAESFTVNVTREDGSSDILEFNFEE
jgi:general secretion pathway protein C